MGQCCLDNYKTILFSRVRYSLKCKQISILRDIAHLCTKGEDNLNLTLCVNKTVEE